MKESAVFRSRRWGPVVALLAAAHFGNFEGCQAAGARDFDANNDGLISLTELRAMVTAQKFKEAKLNMNVGDFLGPDFAPIPGAMEKYLAAHQKEITELKGQIEIEIGGIYGNLNRNPTDLIPISELEAPVNAADETKPIVAKNEVPGVFGTPKKDENSGRSLGPFLLRRHPDQWHDDLKDADGARISYTDNRQAGKSSWSGEGALIYPIQLQGDESGRKRETGSDRWLLLPSTSWHVNQVSRSTADDIEELRFQVPVTYSTPHRQLGWLRHSNFELTPFVLTDFSFRGLVSGATFEYAPYIKGGPIDINAGFRRLIRTDAPNRFFDSLTYSIQLGALTDYSHLHSISQYIVRPDHPDYFRTGLKVKGQLKAKISESVELEGNVGYQGMVGLAGAPDYRDLLTLSFKTWLNEYLGFSVEYQKGETPVAQKNVDLMTVGIEMRF